MTRLLNPADLPDSIWRRAEGHVLVPPALAEAYEAQINSLGLRPLSLMRDPESPPIGGITQEETDCHFAQAFDASVARIELAILDPYSVLGQTSDAVIRISSGDRIVLTDAPCGAGAAGLSMLCTLAELRRREVLPRHPLQVAVVGAEIAAGARQHAERMFNGVSESLADQAIFVEHKTVHWDVLDRLSNTDLIQEVLRVGNDGRPCCLFIANFSGFLQRDGRRRQADPQLEELFRHVSRSGGAAFWIEPATNQATNSGGLMAWLFDRLQGAWAQLFSSDDGSSGDGGHRISRARYRRVLEPTQIPRLNISVIRREFGGR